MLTNVYCIYDDKAEVYLPPFCCVNHGMAIRSMSEVVNDPRTTIFKYPHEFTLFHVAVFDDSKGLITPLKTPNSIGKAIEYKRSDDDIRRVSPNGVPGGPTSTVVN